MDNKLNTAKFRQMLGQIVLEEADRQSGMMFDWVSKGKLTRKQYIKMIDVVNNGF